MDSSLYYVKYSKTVDVGSATCTSRCTINAGEYLNYIYENNLWNKFSKLYMITETDDSTSYISRNLLEGMYVMNPHNFDVEIEYIQFV
jgi:hypothetical protein